MGFGAATAGTGAVGALGALLPTCEVRLRNDEKRVLVIRLTAGLAVGATVGADFLAAGMINWVVNLVE